MTVRRVRLLVDATPLAADRLTGVGHVLLETLRALGDDRFRDRLEVVLFAPSSETAAVRRRGLPFAVRGVPLPRRVVGLLTRTALPLDLLVGRGVYFFPNYRNWAVSRRSSSITFVHDACFAVAPELVPAARRALLTTRMPGWLARSDLVATGTPSAAAEIAEHLGVPESRLRVLPTTVDATAFHPRSAEEVASVTRRVGVDRYLLFVGAIEPRKNVAALVRAFAAADRPAGRTLLIVGAASWDDDDVRAAVDEATAGGADVRLSPVFVEDHEMPALMTGADALALVSLHEGFGLPALEAVATGTPVIVSDIPGIRDALRGHEEAARFVPVGDEEALRDAIRTALATPRRVDPGVIRPWTEAADALADAAVGLARA
ncbi:Glycosyltransferase involved in cell wall bisynthesis [Rathayibacter oskolensis]|uniref:Glycosyltransferase involved in cell wall bisynthesis n=1 Tax=Rathayibacter oskolensis TaxID=1891671 RepID=A0A1X7N7C1_9MICO|nr:glycosyltransferase family 1 protein [Rathayibacter oskolensis]SMH33371.1 Glycosyltransferase involved in cell wall bisynthesis [Rathayibacter oskolensis]